MYGCSTAATIAASSSSSGEADSGDLVDSVRERVAELSGSDSTSSMDPSDIDEDPGYRVRLKNVLLLVTFDIEDRKPPLTLGILKTLDLNLNEENKLASCYVMFRSVIQFLSRNRLA